MKHSPNNETGVWLPRNNTTHHEIKQRQKRISAMSNPLYNTFPTVSNGKIGGEQIQTVNARDLHTFLENGDKFATWIKDKIETYNFVENQDFMSFSENTEKPKGGRPSKEYAISLDMAKELAMVERNEKGRIVRKYFIQCEKIAKNVNVGIDAATMEMIRRSDGITRMLSHKVTTIEKTVEFMCTRVQPHQPVVIIQGKTAGEILRANGFGGIKGLAAWFGNRLEAFGCRVNNNGSGYLGVSRARLFDPNKTDLYLKSGGKFAIRQKIAERQGHRNLRLVGQN